MEVEAKITRADLVKMQIFLIPKIRAYIYWFLFFFICAGFGGRDSLERTGLLPWLLALLLITVVGFLAFLIFCIGYQLLFANEKNGFIGKQIFRLTDWGFEEKSVGTELKTSWESVEKIYKTKNYLYIQISGYRIHIVPRRSFESDEKFYDFVASVEKSKKNA